MGIGIFLVWPLAKRFGKKNVTLVGFIIYAVGSLICFMFPENMIIVLIGQFIKNIGGLPCAYVFMALFADALDGIEWKTGFRADGVAMSVYSIITVAMVGICTGVFNLFLSKLGYVAPVVKSEYIATPGLVTQLSEAQIFALTDPLASIAFVQNDGVNKFITFAFVGLEVITGILCAFILFFVNVEKTISKKHEVLVEREKIEFAKVGKVWLPADERNAIEIRKQEEVALENYKEELKVKCAKKILVYEVELQKYIDSMNKKKQEQERKANLAKEKEKAKLEKRLAKLTEKDKEKQALKEEKINKLWEKEKEVGEASYQKYQEELLKYES